MVRPSHSRVVLTVRTKLNSEATGVVRQIASRLVADPEFLTDPDQALAGSVAEPLAGAGEHVTPAAELAVLTCCTEQLGELSGVDQMRLQMAMDRRAKLLESLSAEAKKSSDTSDAIIANLK
jgi:hypothetical protein